MIQGCFHRVIGAKAIGSSGHHSDFVVQALDGTTGNLSFGFEPVEQQLLMGAEHSGHFLHWLNSAAQGSPGPILQKVAGPSQGFVAPEVLEDFLEDPGSRRGQLAGHQRIEFDARPAAHATAPAQQFPAHFFEVIGLGRCRRAQPGTPGPARLIHRLIQVHRDVKPIQHMQRLASLCGDHVQVRSPHVGADKAQSRNHLWPQCRQTPAQRGLSPSLVSVTPGASIP